MPPGKSVESVDLRSQGSLGWLDVTVVEADRPAFSVTRSSALLLLTSAFTLQHTLQRVAVDAENGGNWYNSPLRMKAQERRGGQLLRRDSVTTTVLVRLVGT